MKNKTKSGSGMIGGVRSPMAVADGGCVKPSGASLKPSVAANTTRPGVSKKHAPISTPYNKSGVVGS